jgi:effector-binding domain-containing protein
MTSYAVQVQQLDSVPLAVIRRQTRPSELSRVIPESCGLVWNAVKAQQAKGGRHIALYWDWGMSIRLEVGVELLGPFAEQGDIVHSATPAGLVTSATHFGPYAELRGAHDAVHRYCTEHHLRLAGPSWEIYGHWLPEWDADPSKIRTDVYYLLSGSERAPA